MNGGTAEQPGEQSVQARAETDGKGIADAIVGAQPQRGRHLVRLGQAHAMTEYDAFGRTRGSGRVVDHRGVAARDRRQRYAGIDRCVDGRRIEDRGLGLLDDAVAALEGKLRIQRNQWMACSDDGQHQHDRVDRRVRLDGEGSVIGRAQGSDLACLRIHAMQQFVEGQ